MTTDLEDRLRSDLPRLADHLAPPTDAAVLAPDRSVVDLVMPGPAMSARRRGPRVLLVAAAVVALVATGVVLATRDDGTEGPPRGDTHTSTASAPDSVTTAPPRNTGHLVGHGEQLPDPPLDERAGSTSVWTGSEWLVFGGHQGSAARQDAAAYSPATGRWRQLATNPTFAPAAMAVWTGSEVVVLNKADGWTYDVEADRWRDLPEQAPLTGKGSNDRLQFAGAAWTGNRVVAVGYRLGSDGVSVDLGARTYDPVTGRWGRLRGASDPITATDASAIVGTAWDGRAIQAWRADGSGWSFDPARSRWTHLPDLVVPRRTPETTTVIAGDGERTYALVATRRNGATVDDLWVFEAGAWRKVPFELIGDFPAAEQEAVVAGDELVVWGTSLRPLAVDLHAGTFRALPQRALRGGFDGTALWTGHELLTVGGRDADGDLTNHAYRLT